MPVDDDGGEVPPFADVRDRVLDEVVTFVRVLRRAGASVPVNAGIVAARTLAAVGFDDRERVRTALRIALVSREADIETYERLFPEFWHRLTDTEPPDIDLPGQEETIPSERVPLVDEPGAGAEPSAPEETLPDEYEEVVRRSVSRDSEPAPGGDEQGESVTRATYSPVGRSERVAVDMSPSASDDDLARAIRRLTRAVAGLRGRRWEAGGTERLDIRRALRRSFATGGTVLAVPRRERTRSAVRAVVLVDVSRSVLDVIDRDFLVRFLRQAKREWRDARVFFFDTDVREVTAAFDEPSPADAAVALEAAEAEWGGGTRIGHAIDEVRRRHPTAVDRDTVVFLVSDGLEVGEIDVLDRGMAWLSRRAAAVLWLNPLSASVDYEPACRGMAVSLPYVDGLFAFTGPDDVAEMARQLDRRGVHGTVGYEHDPRRIAAATRG